VGVEKPVEIVATSDAAALGYYFMYISPNERRIDGSAAADGANEQINKLRFIETCSRRDSKFCGAEQLFMQ
jgi:hypothetical protein